jgi:membrane protease YdiL (CAAX protease family)
VLDPLPEPPLLPDPPSQAPPLPITLAQRLGALIEVILCSGFPTQIFIVSVMTLAGMRLESAPGRWSPVFVSTLSLLDTLLVIGLVVFFVKSHRERVRDVLLGTRRVLSEVVLGLWLFPVVFGIAIVMLLIVYAAAPQLHNVPRNPLEDMLQTRRDAVMFAFVAMIAGGVREEVQRGFILHRFSQYLGGGPVGVVIYSFLFGLGHSDQGWDATIAVATLGAVWGTIYLIRRSIVAPMVSHAAFNLAQLVKFMALH